MMRRLRLLPGVLAAVAVASAVAALAALAPGSPLVESCAGAGTYHAALVVEHGDGSIVTRCVAFGTSSVSGEWLLNTSRVSWSGQSFGGFGDAVCALDGEPAHYSDCPGKDYYWAVFVSRGGGSWQLASVGISTLTLSDGDAEGFRYVPSVGTAAAPPSPSGVCAAASESAAASPAATRLGGSPTVAATPASPATPSSGGSPAAAATNSPVAAVSSPTAAGGTAAAPLDSPAGVQPPTSAVPPAPSPGSGVDLGLLAAALVGGGLAGLALLRLLAARRSP
ncbi:MAG: hypothetical protein ACHQ01_01790 [Candidatus Limnocylindrales bacterium]